MNLPRWTSFAALVALTACAPPVPVPLTPSPASEATGQLAPAGTRWSVRIHSDADPTRAQEVASEAEPRFDLPVTLVKAGGTTRVEVGPFATEAEAREFVGVARARGYRSASVVRASPASTPSVDPDAH